MPWEQGQGHTVHLPDALVRRTTSTMMTRQRTAMHRAAPSKHRSALVRRRLVTDRAQAHLGGRLEHSTPVPPLPINSVPLSPLAWALYAGRRESSCRATSTQPFCSSMGTNVTSAQCVMTLRNSQPIRRNNTDQRFDQTTSYLGRFC